MHVVSKGESPISGCDANSFGSIEEPAPDTKWIVVHYRGWLERVSHLSRSPSFVGMLKCVTRKTNEFHKAGYCFSLRFLLEGWRRTGYLPSTGTKNFSRVILNKLRGTLPHTVTTCVHTRWTYNCYYFFFITSCTLPLSRTSYTEGNFVSTALYFDRWT